MNEKPKEPMKLWAKVGIVAGAIVSILAILTILYNVDCWNVRAEGTEHFATVETYLAGQKQIEKKFDSWELKEKQKEITALDRMYGEECHRCDSKLKEYYDWLKLERDRLIAAITGAG